MLVIVPTAHLIADDHIVGRLWEVKTVVTDDQKSPAGVGFINGHVIAGWTATGTVSLWRLRDDRLSTRELLDGPLTALATSESSSCVAVAGSDGRIVTWKIIDRDFTLKLLFTKHIPRSYANCLRFSSDGKYLASGGPKGEIVVWELESGREIMNEGTDLGPVSCLLFSDDSLNVCTGHKKGTIAIWKMSTGELVSQWNPGIGAVIGMGWLGMETLMSGGADSRIAAHNIGKKVTNVTEVNNDDDLECLCVLKGVLVCYSIHYGMLELRDVKDNRIIFTDPFPRDSYRCVMSANDDGSQVCIACRKKLGIVRVQPIE